MTDNMDRMKFIWDLMEEASERRDALTEAADFQQDRIEWDGSIRPRLEQTFGTDNVAMGFNNPDKTGSLTEYADANSALEAARSFYDTDIEYFREIRRSLPKPGKDPTS
jgi:hypothetical protein